MVTHGLQGLVRFLVIGFVLLPVLGCEMSNRKSPQPTSFSSVTADDCLRVLEGGVYNEFKLHDRREFSAQLRDWLSANRAALDTFERNANGGLNFSVKGVPIGLDGRYSSRQLKALDEKFQRDSMYVLNNSEAFDLLIRVRDKTLTDRCYDCLEKLIDAGVGGSIIRLRPDRANSSEETAHFVLELANDGPRGRTARIESAFIDTAGTLAGPAGFGPGYMLNSANPLRLIVKRTRNSDGSLPEVNFALYSTAGTVGRQIPRLSAPVTNVVVDPPRPPIVRTQKVPLQNVSIWPLHKPTRDHPKAGRDFGEHGGPTASVAAKLSTSEDGRSIIAKLDIDAFESEDGNNDKWQPDYSHGEAHESYVVYTAPVGSRIVRINGGAEFSAKFRDNGHVEHDEITYASGIVERVDFIGDTGGDDLATSQGEGDCTHVTLYFREISVDIEQAR